MAAGAAAATVSDASGDAMGIVRRPPRTVTKTPSLVLKPLSDCKDLPLLQRRASKGRQPGSLVDSDADASRLSNYRLRTVYTFRQYSYMPHCWSG